MKAKPISKTPLDLVLGKMGLTRFGKIEIIMNQNEISLLCLFILDVNVQEENCQSCSSKSLHPVIGLL